VKADQSLVEHILDLLGNESDYVAQRMFGGYGLYKDGLMFGIVGDGVFYLKVDDLNREKFISAGLSPFTFEKKGKNFKMSYYQTPEDALENSKVMLNWVESAVAAAQRNAKNKKPRK